MKITKEMANRLNCMNYQVCNVEEHYYIQDGMAGIYSFAKRKGFDFVAIIEELILSGHVEFEDENEYSITMI